MSGSAPHSSPTARFNAHRPFRGGAIGFSSGFCSQCRQVSTLTAPSEAVQFGLSAMTLCCFLVSTLTAPSEAVQLEAVSEVVEPLPFQRSPPLPRRCNRVGLL